MFAVRKQPDCRTVAGAKGGIEDRPGALEVVGHEVEKADAPIERLETCGHNEYNRRIPAGRRALGRLSSALPSSAGSPSCPGGNEPLANSGQAVAHGIELREPPRPAAALAACGLAP